MVLPLGIVDRRGDNHSEGELNKIVEEHQADYDNFDKNSLLADSIEGERFDNINQRGDGGSSLAGWDVNELDMLPTKKKRKANKERKDTER